MGTDGGEASVGRLCRRRPERTVSTGWSGPTWRLTWPGGKAADPLGGGVSADVEARFRSYLRCGVLAHGSVRARCSGCREDFLVAFSRPFSVHWPWKSRPGGSTWPSWVSAVRLSHTTHISAILPRSIRITLPKSRLSRSPEGGYGPKGPFWMPS